MPRALNLLRSSLHYRKDSFDQGLRAAGFDVVDSLSSPKPGDVVVCWNRYGSFDEVARHFERCGALALIAENGFLGKAWQVPGEWFALAVGHHAGAGRWVEGGSERWDSWGVKLAPWRHNGHETVILGQRGIGEPGIKSPDRWAEVTRKRIGGRIRPHPGTGPATPLAEDLKVAREVITWHSGAALQALMLGIPVWCDFPQWIGVGAARLLSDWPGPALRDDATRLAMFRRLAWAMHTLDEIRTGGPIARLVAA